MRPSKISIHRYRRKKKSNQRIGLFTNKNDIQQFKALETEDIRVSRPHPHPQSQIEVFTFKDALGGGGGSKVEGAAAGKHWLGSRLEWRAVVEES